MPEASPVIVWFRQDLRLADNPALDAAVAMNAPILPVYILDDTNAERYAAGAASRWWLHQSLSALNDSLKGALRFLRGDAATLLPKLAADSNAAAVFWNRCYEPWRIQRDKLIKASLLKADRLVRSFNGSLLFEPPHVTKKDGTPYRVFTPFYKKGCLERGPAPRTTINAPVGIDVLQSDNATQLGDLKLMPKIRWYDEMAALWRPGEHGARERVEAFLDAHVGAYSETRNRPDLEGVSRLSPHFHFGEVSPHQVWHSAKKLEAAGVDVEPFLRQLIWREFSYYLLYYWPDLPTTNLQRRFDRFPWAPDDALLQAWREGRTGYPIVDAGMRELWRTGYMHNRVRMIVGSFLVKNLLQDWRHGERWFWDTLLDADLANNSASWQWVAGSGADAAPYFRIFNPVTQGRKFDPDGAYVSEYLPELAAVPSSHIHAPWEAPDDMLRAAGVTLSENYPDPIVDLKASRSRALEAYGRLRSGTAES